MQNIFNYALLPNYVYIDKNVISNCYEKPTENHFASPKLTFSPYPLKIKEGEPFQIAFELDLLKEIPIGTKMELEVQFGEDTVIPPIIISVINNTISCCIYIRVIHIYTYKY